MADLQKPRPLLVNEVDRIHSHLNHLVELSSIISSKINLIAPDITPPSTNQSAPPIRKEDNDVICARLDHACFRAEMVVFEFEVIAKRLNDLV